MSVWLSLFKVAVRVRPLNATEVEDKNCTEIVHVLDENVSGYIIKFTFNIFMDTVRRLGGLPFAITMITPRAPLYNL